MASAISAPTAAQAASYNRITTIRATNEDVLGLDDFTRAYRPMKVGISFNCYTGLVVQNWSASAQTANLYHVVECSNPSMVQGGIQSVPANTTDQVSVQSAGSLLLEKTPTYQTQMDIGESFTYGDEPQFYLEAVLSQNQAAGGHGLIKKTGRLQTMEPGVNAILYTVVGDSIMLSVDYNPQIPANISVNNSLRLISVRNGSAVGIPEGQVMYLYIKQVGNPDRTLHCLQFTNSIREGVFNVTKDYLVEVTNPSDQAAGLQGSFVDQLITFNQGLAIIAAQTNSATQPESKSAAFQILLLTDLYKQAKLLYPTDNYA